MNITDEMIDIAASAWELEPSINGLHSALKAALTAASPLIRAQMLEEAAAICNERADRLLPFKHLLDGAQYEEIMLCAQAIRDMAKEG